MAHEWNFIKESYRIQCQKKIYIVRLNFLNGFLWKNPRYLVHFTLDYFCWFFYGHSLAKFQTQWSPWFCSFRIECFLISPTLRKLENCRNKILWFRMSKDSFRELKNYEKLDCPYKSLSDVGKYGFTALCAISLQKLFENSVHDR